jgi:hypothetical protein
MDNKATLKKHMPVDSNWIRINHRFPSRHEGKTYAEKGQPVKVKVAAHKPEGIKFLLNIGIASYLGWPTADITLVAKENHIELTDKQGNKILTYSLDKFQKQL